jgi:GAF domain-containing protein
MGHSRTVTPGNCDALHEAAHAQADVARALASSRDFAAVLELVVGRAFSLLRARQAAVLLTAADGCLHVAASRGLVTQVRELRPRDDRDGIVVTAIRERRPVWSADLLNDPAVDLSPSSGDWAESRGCRAALAVPLLNDARVLGALAVCRGEVGDFSSDEIALARALADHAVIALECARLSAVEAAQARLGEALAEDERELLAELSAERLIPLIGERAARRVSADCTIYSIERQGRWLRRTWSNWAHPLDGMPIDDGVSGVCATTRRGVLVADYTAWPRALPGLLELGVKSIIAEPLLGRSELLAVIVMSRRGVDAPPFDAEDASFLKRLAAQGASLSGTPCSTGGRAAPARRRRAGADRADALRSSRPESGRPGDPAERAGRVRRVLVQHPAARPDGGLEALAANMYEVGHVQPAGIGLSARALAEERAVWTSDILNEPDVAWDEDFPAATSPPDAAPRSWSPCVPSAGSSASFR